MSNPWILSKIGKVIVSVDFLKSLNKIDFISFYKFLGLVLHTNSLPHLYVIEYAVANDAFDVVKDGCQIPIYDIIAKKSINRTHFKFRRAENRYEVW